MTNVLRGILRAFDAGSYTATVQLPGPIDGDFKVPVSRAIAAGEMVAGRQCALLSFCAHDPQSVVLVAVWP